jgi:16S rRNA (guanine(966)-N(2))-methyltransferase RsmD
MVRIIAGIHRGKKLLTPKKADFRPTLDRVKESLFGTIQPVIAGSRVCDLFAGSGNLGYEAISRGAALAVFVDNSPDCISVIHRNNALLDARKEVRIYQRDAMSWVEEMGRKGARFDIVFADPPYRSPSIRQLPECIAESRILTEKGIFVLECPHAHFESLSTGTLSLVSRKKYGDTGVVIFST